ncbi:hypothetical protein Dsin_017054 [Dipteronia sinensis]|uniref:pyruvate decarboxylase n=1 Tax=Dipteronia sinensis TaxID=43782 RepID=A0AAE0E7I8_9ROSI|nr:hypothetical protein Dsin_017054 [Dipteronia sinensis]
MEWRWRYELVSYIGMAISLSKQTLGYHLAHRQVEIGVSYIFSVHCDSNLTLLDYFVVQPGLNLIGCCNELNAGYAADGYARSRGVGACVVTFGVGGLSIVNTIAGAYSEDLPVICIVGGRHSNDYYGARKILHHTIGLPDFNQELACFRAVTCHQFHNHNINIFEFQAVIYNLEDADHQIDTAISTCLKESKPVYISISCSLIAIPHPTFTQKSIPVFLSPNHALGERPNTRRPSPFYRHLLGCRQQCILRRDSRTADASLFVGPVFDDFNSIGDTLLFRKNKAIIVEPERVLIPNGPIFRCVLMKDFLEALSKKLEHNTTAYENHKRIYVPEPEALPKSDPKEGLKVNVLRKHIQKMLLGDMVLTAETGDSWFLCQKLRLPQGCR